MRFDGGLPAIHSLLRAGDDGRVAIEVLAQRDARHVRGIALTPTQGLARGMPVQDTGGPLQAPVGKAILSRMFDVFGNTIDREPPLADVGHVAWRSVHRQPPPLVRRSTKSEVFETGIKAIDVLMPLENGGKAGLFGGAGYSGNGNGYAEALDSIDVDHGNSAISVSLWVKVTALDTNWQTIIAKGNNGGDYRIARRNGTSQVSFAGGNGDIHSDP